MTLANDNFLGQERMLRGGGVFGDENSRFDDQDGKRRALGNSTFEPIPGGSASSFAGDNEPARKRDVWDEIENMMMQDTAKGSLGIQSGLPTPGQEILKSL